MEKKVKHTLLRIPGYRGYQSLEDRRDDDKRLRQAISVQLDGMVDSLTRVAAQLASERKIQQISAIERLVSSTRHISDRVRTATYGYGGLFSAQPVGAGVLDQVRQFDEAFQQEVSTLDAALKRLASTPEGPLEVDIKAYSDEIVRLNALFDARSTVVDTAQPTEDASILAMLSPVVVVKESPIASLKLGDAFSVLGDDYIVEAVVRFDEDYRHLQLVRVGKDATGNDLWLSGGTTGDLPSARLTEGVETTSVLGAGVRAEVTVTTREQSSDAAPGQYWYGTTDADNAAMRYVVGNETRNFVGKLIVDEDVEVYGQA